MSRGGHEDESYISESPPGDVPAPRYQPSLSHDYQFALEIQRAIGELSTKIDRLIKDNESTDVKLDEVRHQVSFVRGAIFVVVTLAAVFAFVMGNKIHISIGDPVPVVGSAGKSN